MDNLLTKIRQVRDRAVDPDRADRAEEVKATYKIEMLTPGLYMVRHPTEDERSYLVDLARATCECPDFSCRQNPDEGVCKHIIAMWLVTGREFDVSAFTHNSDADIKQREEEARVSEAFAKVARCADPYAD